MLAAYGVDVLDQKTTPRRIYVLMQRLPAGYWPDENVATNWSIEAHLLATVIDAISGLTYVTLRAAGAKSAKVPKPFVRPGGKPARRVAQDQPTKTSWADLGRALAGAAGRGGRN